MSVIYKKIHKIIGPLVFLENKHDAKYGEIVKVYSPKDNMERMGQVIEITEQLIVVEIFEETRGLSVSDSNITFLNDIFKIKLSPDMIGNFFNSLGEPIDPKTRKHKNLNLLTSSIRDVDGYPLNPFARAYPSDVIQTGISVIDGLFTLVKGQKLPIFSAQGLPHDELAAQIVSQSKTKNEDTFLIIFCGIGLLQDQVDYFINIFQESGNLQNIISFFNYADDPIMERLLIPRIALTCAEYFAFEREMDTLVILTDITNYAEALRELSSAKEEVPSRKGFPGYLYSDFASLFERTGCVKGNQGSITQIPIITMPNDDISHPIPDTTGYITEGQLVLNRSLHKKHIYPPFEVLASISRLMKDAIGKETTRGDHADISAQMIASYSRALEIRDLISIIGEDELTREQKRLVEFARDFENLFLNQGVKENRDFNSTFKIIWRVLSKLSKEQLFRIHSHFIEEYYTTR